MLSATGHCWLYHEDNGDFKADDWMEQDDISGAGHKIFNALGDSSWARALVKEYTQFNTYRLFTPRLSCQLRNYTLALKPIFCALGDLVPFFDDVYPIEFEVGSDGIPRSMGIKWVDAMGQGSECDLV